jgi:Zn finger protein HypA/HybF involved in hydrogenase expression
VTVNKDSSYDMYCPECGKMINSKDNYCMHCGKAFRGRKILNKIEREITKRDNIEYCPRCNSQNIKLYRNGYNYKEGLWFSILGNARDGAFAAGLDANKTRCRCMNCGKDWLTDYDYRLL